MGERTISVILIPSGLPASGKTTFAREWVAQDPANRQRINYDDIRVDLFDCKGASYFKGKDIRKREQQVKDVAEKICLDWLTLNPVEHSVIIDNTNLTERARAPWVAIGRTLGVPVEHHEMSTTVEECVRRDRLRTGDDRVGRGVIERMAITTGWIDWDDLPLKWGPSSGPDIVVVDIDGTLSDPSHRLRHVRQRDATGERTQPRWDLFHAEVDQDLPKTNIVELVKRLSLHYHIIIVTGRSPEHGCGIKTEEWLDKYLREDGHTYYRTCSCVKPGTTNPTTSTRRRSWISCPRTASPLSSMTASRWLTCGENGVTCLQVAKGDF
jgi:predicted kinase